MMLNLKDLVDKIENGPYLDHDDVKLIETAAYRAEMLAIDVESLVDGEDDELAGLLSPVVCFLRGLAGVAVKGDSDSD